MLVDLGRNDVGRVAAIGSVEVNELMAIERYSHVIHIVSNVRGELAPDKTAFDLFVSAFPAGTLSGAPKIRAMQIISELEPQKRSLYGGAIGYFGYNGNLDTCIVIRTIVMKGKKVFINAGAGIVADSDPAARVSGDLEQSARHVERGRARRAVEEAMILLIDNYDSFTYNLYHYLGEARRRGAGRLQRQDHSRRDRRLRPEKIVISPGPCTPKEAGISCNVIKRFGAQTPILGVCLGHQSIGAAYGGKIVRAPSIMHGKLSDVSHDAKTIFRDLKNPFAAMRYHSLVIDPQSLPAELVVSAQTDDGVIMAVRHRIFPVEGVQFHPESILAEEGKKLLKNFLDARLNHEAALLPSQALSLEDPFEDPGRGRRPRYRSRTRETVVVFIHAEAADGDAERSAAVLRQTLKTSNGSPTSAS